ncbi:MAG: hypothetical protein ACREXY_12725, partial [Gammaproteobacteria bacterium]
TSSHCAVPFQRRLDGQVAGAAPRGGGTRKLERMGPVFDREGSALFDHDLVGRNRRQLLRGLHMERSFRVGERDN